jgi:biopolymer transport protein TolR
VNLPKHPLKLLEVPAHVPIVSIEANGNLYLNKEKTDKNLLGTKLKFLLKDGRKEVYIKADKSVPFEQVSALISILQKSNITKIGLLGTATMEE